MANEQDVSKLSLLVTDICDTADLLLDDDRVESGWGFFEDVKKTAKDIRKTSQEKQIATAPMLQALKNMLTALNKWKAKLD